MVAPVSNESVSIIRFLLNTARKYAEYDCMRYLKRGEYVGITWEEVLQVTRLFSLGFQSLGLQYQERVALMAHTRYEWRLVDYGIMFAGGTTVTIYPTLAAAQVEYILKDASASIVVVDDIRNLKKVLQVQANCPSVKHVILIEPDVQAFKDQNVLGLDDLVERGEKFAQQEAKKSLENFDTEIKAIKKKLNKCRLDDESTKLLEEWHKIDARMAEAAMDPFINRYLQVKESDIATIVYTSGTTGVPKGALLTHKNMAYNAIQTAQVVPLKQHDISLSFLPLSHVLERQVSQFVATYIGFTVAIARDTESIIENLDQVKPTFITSVPRIYEKLYARVIADVQEGSETKQKIFENAVKWGWEYKTTVQDGKEVSAKLALKNWLADKLVFSKVTKILGGRLRFMFSGGAALNPVLAKFFFAAGFKIMEGYGLTETSPVLNVNRLDNIKVGTVGPAIPDTEIKIAEDGEICARGPQVFQGYWNKPAETAAAFDQEGWYHTGDLGEILEGGILKITGRKKEIIVLRTGKKVSPVVTEAAVELDRHIAHMCVIGDDMKYLVALVEPDFEYLAEWLETHNLTQWKVKDFEVFKGMNKEQYEAVMARRWKVIEMPDVIAFYEQVLKEMQKNLSDFEQVKKFALVPDEWNEYNVLTPSLKMKRRDIKEKYKDLLAKIYQE